MSLPMENKAAVLGLGIIGSRVFARLVSAGWEVTCWNRTAKGLTGEAATAEVAVKDAAVISLYLKDAPATREVVTRITAVLQPGQILLNHATLDLETTRWLEKTCLGCDCHFLDAPFTGSKLAAGNGQLFYYVAGDEKLVSELATYLSISGKGQLFSGEVGSATVLKLATNLISACTVQALAESFAIASGHGISAECLIRAVSENACASALSGMKLPTMAAGNFETHFSLSNMEKDSRYMLALAASAGVETPAITAVSQRMAALAAQGLGDLDYSALVKPYLREA
jgi:3-hydroxyisobutyrate dehydrogenase-like beta-hydroxyacid dehydrogenase